MDGDVLGQNVIVAVRIADQRPTRRDRRVGSHPRPDGLGRRHHVRRGRRGRAQGPVAAVAGPPGGLVARARRDVPRALGRRRRRRRAAARPPAAGRLRGRGAPPRRLAGRDPQRPVARRRHAPCRPATGWSASPNAPGSAASRATAASTAPRREVDADALAAAHAPLRGRARRRPARRATPARARPAASAAPGPGVKCLHAHYAWYLAGGDDPVGRWVARRGPRTGRFRGHDRRRLDRSRHQLDPPPRGAPGRRRARHRSSAATRITRLGQGVGSHRPAGRRGRRAHARRACASTAAVIDEHGVERVRIAATVRRSRRRQPRRVLRRGRGGRRRSARAAVGRRGGPLSFLGATADLDPARGPFLVVDIGGGSTEFIRRHRPVRGRDVGRHRLRPPDREVPRPRPARPEELTACISCRRGLPRRRRARGPGQRRGPHARRPGRHGHHGGRGRARARRLRPRRHPPLRAHPRRGRGRVPHARHRVAAPTASTTRASRRRGPT